MKTFELSDEEFETLRDIFNEHGCDCPSVDCGQFQALGEKFGILEPIPEPTEEELKKREEFKNSPFALKMTELFKQTNKLLVQKFIEEQKEWKWWDEKNWGDLKVGTKLKIKLPNDYIVGK